VSPQSPQNPHDLRAAAMDGRHAHVDRATFRRRRLLVGAGVAVLAVVVVLVLAYAWPGFATSDPAAPAAVTVTVTEPAPGPTGQAAPLPSSATPFLKALPATVGPWVRTGAGAADAGDGTEAWTVTYAGDGARLTVTASQYATAGDAQAAYAAASTAGTAPTEHDDVFVGGKRAGSYAVVPGSGGNATVTWRNGTAVLSANGPEAAVRQLFGAFPM
jgi:hypothetical protein